jgi:hypothetical protein
MVNISDNSNIISQGLDQEGLKRDIMEIKRECHSGRIAGMLDLVLDSLT